MNCLMYLRKSRADPEAETVEGTLRRHEEQLEDLAARRGDRIVKVYKEVVSGGSLYTRPQMLRLLDDVGTGEYDAVLCMDIDRLGRSSMAEQGIILDTFKYSHTKIVTMDKVYDLADEADDEASDFKSFMARMELRIYKKRFRRSLEKTVSDGGTISEAPFGYIKTRIGRLPTLEPEPVESEFVKMIFALYTEQGVGTERIARELNALGAKPRRGSTAFSRASVRYILRNPVYLGSVVWNRKHYIRKGTCGSEKHLAEQNPEEQWIVRENAHPALVTQEEFDKAQEIMEKSWRVKSYTGEIKNPLASLVFCGNCGRKMVQHPSGRRVKENFLMCPQKGCIPTTRTEDVERAVLDLLRETLRALSLETGEAPPPGLSVPEHEIAAAEEELRKCGQQTERLHTLLEQGVYDTDTFLQRRGILRAREAELQAFLSGKQDFVKKIRAPGRSEVRQRLASVLDVYEAGSPAVRNELLKAVVGRIIYYKTEKGSGLPFSVFVELKFPRIQAGSS
ncbi:MAG TPA: recombinase family protein [Oscillospiraceae bacterium]|nr:recombinase family protein [Oscillospiraceae bacterium]HRW57379.1 recombinase family protein [Oscillospiraceae bacterium]